MTWDLKEITVDGLHFHHDKESHVVKGEFGQFITTACSHLKCLTIATNQSKIFHADSRLCS